MICHAMELQQEIIIFSLPLAVPSGLPVSLHLSPLNPILPGGFRLEIQPDHFAKARDGVTVTAVTLGTAPAAMPGALVLTSVSIVFNFWVYLPAAVVAVLLLT